MSRGSFPSMEDDFSRALLGSAEGDAPSHAAYAKVAGALGVGIGFGVGASLPAAAAVGAAGVAGAARWSSSLGAKLLLGLSGALLVGAGALRLRNSPANESVLRAAPAAAAAARAATGVAPLVSAVPADGHTPLVSPLSPAPSATSLPRPKFAGQGSALVTLHPLAVPPVARRVTHAAQAQEPSNSSLAEQVQSLDRARLALAARDSSSALAEIARYRAAWPAGVFLTEASVLEIEALAARGERSLAQARAAAFVAAHPDSPQVDRLRALISHQNH